MKLTIYLDMDGVLTDFDKQYIKVNGVSPSLKSRDKEDHDKRWEKFISSKSFAKLDYYKGAEILLKVISVINETPDVNVEILSSAGGALHYDEVKAQKVKWLKDHNIPYKVNIVKHRSKKKDYANKNTILIDDTDDVVTGFKSAGGRAILHRDSVATIEQLIKMYLEFKN